MLCCFVWLIILQVGSAFLDLGLKPRDRLGVFGPNCVEWMISMQVRTGGRGGEGRERLQGNPIKVLNNEMNNPVEWMTNMQVARAACGMGLCSSANGLVITTNDEKQGETESNTKYK